RSGGTAPRRRRTGRRRHAARARWRRHGAGGGRGRPRRGGRRRPGARRQATILSAVTAIRVRPSGPLSGTVRVCGAKNSVLKLLAATLLAPGEYVLRNVPDIADVEC